MKNLSQYLIESEQTYDFRIKIANVEIDNDTLDRIEHALNTFSVNSLSKPKSLPIEEKSLDFPTLGHCEVSLIIASLNYPCNDEQVRQAISQQSRLPLANIVVTPKNQPEELLRDQTVEDETTNKKYEPILTKELEDISGGQQLVGKQRVDTMLKELETRKMEFAAKDVKQDSKTTNSLPIGNKSPVAKGKK